MLTLFIVITVTTLAGVLYAWSTGPHEERVAFPLLTLTIGMFIVGTSRAYGWASMFPWAFVAVLGFLLICWTLRRMWDAWWERRRTSPPLTLRPDEWRRLPHIRPWRQAASDHGRRPE